MPVPRSTGKARPPRLPRTTKWPALAILALLTAATAAAAPPSAAPWFDRAERDIAALPAETPKDLAVLQPSDLAAWLFRTAPTEGRRQLAIRLTLRAADQYLKHPLSAEQEVATRVTTAAVLASFGDAGDARRWLAAADAPPTTSPTTDPFVRTFVDPTGQPWRLEAQLLLGQPMPAVMPNLGGIGYLMLVRTLADDGRPDLARQVIDRQRTLLNARAATQPATDTAAAADAASSRSEMAHELADTGDFAAALKEAATIGTGPQINWTVRAYGEIAQAAHHAGRTDVCRSACGEVVKLLPQPGVYDLSAAEEVAGLLLRSGDRAAAIAAADVVRHHLDQARPPALPTDGLSTRMRLAQFYVEAGDRADYRSLVERAEADLSAVAKLPDRQTDSDLNQRATDYFDVAAAHARAGGVASANIDVAAALRCGKPGDLTLDDGWSDLADAYADAGEFDLAVAALNRRPPHEFDDAVRHVARRMALAGRSDQAWRLATAATVDAHSRMEAEYQLTVIAVAARQADAVAARLPGLPTANERALVELAVGQALMGKAYDGFFAAFRPREE